MGRLTMVRENAVERPPVLDLTPDEAYVAMQALLELQQAWMSMGRRWPAAVRTHMDRLRGFSLHVVASGRVGDGDGGRVGDAEPVMYGITEAARLIGKHRSTIDRWITRGDLATVTMNRRRYVPADEIARLRRSPAT